ncbi:uncharacterized protein K452DRAFT_309171 [Aplosporella prunicola CBS 121167]|uniref:4'-phosphopantetheinyl transferase domain-containing protein n=1 Tax=Aplosporella prunicola CBS 121167 TaxID=1176127 RepID=A0A6A6BDF0_9PEZI|nr:uncharacterized protein K452DRAFT_309171 [Aplosporella prunicola CBS 121167]KAF2141403.1 hypothetical protein K452DRAFT_309171 [Aplosporella prunicola CBS 121167]
MPPRPFPYPFHVGIDICSIPRIRRLMTSKSSHADIDPNKFRRFLFRLFSFPEILDFSDKHPDLFNPDLAPSPAKEAMIKAFTPRRVTFREVVLAKPQFSTEGPQAIVLDEEQAMTTMQRCFLRDRLKFTFLAEVVGEPAFDTKSPDLCHKLRDSDGQVVHVSISHDGDYATAVCIAPICTPVQRSTT